MTTLSNTFARALCAHSVRFFAPALALCGLAFAQTAARADALTFTVDSAQSYLTLNIPNFSLSGLSINLTAQNRTNGAPLGTAWSANTNTGNTAFISGTIATTIGGSLSGQSLSSVQFISGSNSLAALASGNYRPNPAAYNAVTSAYNNNGPAPGNYGNVVHASLGNAALTSFDNVTYDIGSAPLPADGGVGAGTFLTGSNLNTGILNAIFSVQGLSIFLVGQVIPNAVTSFGGTAANTLPSATYVFTSPTNLQLAVPVNIPISIDVGGGTFINGNAFGQFVANAAVPEPSTMVLAGLGLVSIVAMVRRRRQQHGA